MSLEVEEGQLIETSCVPDITDGTTELAHLQEEINQKGQAATQVPAPFSMATLQSVALDERSKELHIERMAFPTLFPNGSASFNNPRMRTVSLTDYHAHLMRYQDGRFARHPKFRYWALNTQMRQQASAAGSWFTNKSPDKMASIDTLREMAQDPNSHLSDIIARKSNSIRGTRPFWMRKSRELGAMVQERNSDFFATASPADMQWADLYKHMPDRELAENMTDEQRRRLNFRLLQENPHIAAVYLERRWRLFFHMVFKKIFNVEDYWYRFEWQSRGSGHIHGLYWTKDPYPVEELEGFLAHWGPLATAINPDAALPPASVHPCSRPFEQRANTKRDQTEILNRCQRHTKCTPQYCFRKKKGSNDRVCRFHFPRKHQDSPTVSNETNPKWQTYAAARNDSLLNTYNPAFIMGWVANTDVSLCTDQKAVLHYIAKYCSKAEIKSAKLQDMVKDLLPKISSKAPMLSLATRLMNKLIGERDYSAQEVCHLLLGLNLTECSRAVQSIDARPSEKLRRDLSKLDQGDATPDATYLERYCDRAPELEQLTLLEAQTKYNWSGERKFFLRTRGKPKILNLFPLYSSHPEHPDYEDFCQVKMMLHHPFRQPGLEDLLKDEEWGLFDSWQSAYEHCCEHHFDHPPDPLGPTSEHVEEETDTESLDANEKGEQGQRVEQYEELLGLRRPHHDGTQIQIESDLGRRPGDKQHDWLKRSQDYPVNVQEFATHLDTLRRSIEVKTAPQSLEEAGDVSILNAGQRQVFGRVVDHYVESDGGQLLLHLDGVAGTGKSKVIDMISSHLAVTIS